MYVYTMHVHRMQGPVIRAITSSLCVVYPHCSAMAFFTGTSQTCTWKYASVFPRIIEMASYCLGGGGGISKQDV